MVKQGRPKSALRVTVDSLGKRFAQLNAAAELAQQVMPVARDLATRARKRIAGREAAKAKLKTPSPAPGRLIKATTAPVSVSYTQGPSYHKVTRSTSDVSTVVGKSFLGPVFSIDPADQVVAATYSVNPTSFTDRLAVLARTFDKYAYKSLRLTYVPYVGTNATGQVRMYIDRDYLDWVADPANNAQIMSQQSAVSCSPWQSMSTSMRRDPCEMRSYFTQVGHAQLPETEQFRVVVYATTGTSTNEGHIGELFIEYELDLIGPVLQARESYGLGNFNIGPYISFRADPESPHWLPSVPLSSGINSTMYEVCVQVNGGVDPLIKWGRAGPLFTGSAGTTLWFKLHERQTEADVFHIYSTYQDAIGNNEATRLTNMATSNSGFTLKYFARTVIGPPTLALV